MRTIRWTERAATDLLAIGDYITADNPDAAWRWVERLRKRAVKASRTPRGGRVVPEIGRDDVREVFVGAYRIVYRVMPREIVVLTVFEGHRLFSGFSPEVTPEDS